MYAHKLTSEEAKTYFPKGRFFGKWGGLITVAADDYLAIPYPQAEEIYAIKRGLFEKTYMLDEPSSVPTQEELLAKWAVALNEMGSLYGEHDVVHAMMPRLGDEQRDKGPIDEYVIELWVD